MPMLSSFSWQKKKNGKTESNCQIEQIKTQASGEVDKLKTEFENKASQYSSLIKEAELKLIAEVQRRTKLEEKLRNYDADIKQAQAEAEKKALAQIQTKAKEIAKAWVKGEIIAREQAQIKADQELKQRIETEKELKIAIARLGKIEEQLKFENQTRKTAETQSEEFKKSISIQQQELETLTSQLNDTRFEAAEIVAKIKSQLEDKASQYAQSILKIQSRSQ